MHIKIVTLELVIICSKCLVSEVAMLMPKALKYQNTLFSYTCIVHIVVMHHHLTKCGARTLVTSAVHV